MHSLWRIIDPDHVSAHLLLSYVLAPALDVREHALIAVVALFGNAGLVLEAQFCQRLPAALTERLSAAARINCGNTDVLLVVCTQLTTACSQCVTIINTNN